MRRRVEAAVWFLRRDATRFCTMSREGLPDSKEHDRAAKGGRSIT